MLRGALANIPVLGDGEFYFATDACLLFVGLGGGNLQVHVMGVQIADPTTTTQQAAVQPKGTQGTFMLCVQDAKDCGRQRVILSLTKVTAITAEALVTLTQKKGTGATTTGTSYTVSAGKTLRIQSAYLSITNVTTATSPINVAVRLREGAAGGGAVSATSDIIAELESGVPVSTATLQSPGYPTLLDIPDGLEISSGQQIGVSEISSSVNAQVTLVLIGFEY